MKTRLFMESKYSDYIFLDTSFFKALVDLKDDFHSNASDIWATFQENNTTLITSNFVLDETFTLLRVKCGIEAVKEFRERLAEGLRRMKIVRVLLRDETNAWDWFWNEWSGLSFTDCVSFALMKRLNIKRVATFDRHFSKAGFAILT